MTAAEQARAEVEAWRREDGVDGCVSLYDEDADRLVARFTPWVERAQATQELLDLLAPPDELGQAQDVGLVAARAAGELRGLRGRAERAEARASEQVDIIKALREACYAAEAELADEKALTAQYQRERQLAWDEQNKTEADLAEARRQLGKACDPERIMAWYDADPRKPAHLAFTAGPERQIAYRMETTSDLCSAALKKADEALMDKIAVRREAERLEGETRDLRTQLATSEARAAMLGSTMLEAVRELVKAAQLTVRSIGHEQFDSRDQRERRRDVGDLLADALASPALRDFGEKT